MSDYGVLPGVSLPGCLVDTTRYNIDGCTVCKDETLLIGKVVFVSSVELGYKMVSSRFDEPAKPMGVTIRSQVVTSKDEVNGYAAYRNGDPVNVVTRGKVWVLTEDIQQAPSFNKKVYVADDGFVSESNGQISDGWVFTGDFMKFDNQFNIVGVSIGAPKREHKILLTSAIIESDIDERIPQPNNKPIQLRVTVAPRNATDKTGYWTCWEDEARTSQTHNIADVDDNGLVTPTGTGVGVVFVNWNANDSSGTQDTYRIEFEEPPAIQP